MRSLLFLSEPGVALQSRRGALCVRDGDGTETHYTPRVHKLKTIILAGHGASITSEAIRWCGREGVALFLMERNGECVAVLADAPECDARRRALAMRERQWGAFLDPRKRLAVAEKIVRAKLQTLGLHPADARGFREELAEARKIEDLMVAEARAGAAFFLRFRGSEIRFKDEVPIQWRTFTARAGSQLRGKGGASRARHASTPAGAALNYAYTVALGQCTRAIIGQGLDPCIGFLHSPKPGRLSPSYDVLELLRANLAEAVFAVIPKQTFRRADFEIDARGIVRLSAPLAREVATLALRVAPMSECVKNARRLAGWF